MSANNLQKSENSQSEVAFDWNFYTQFYEDLDQLSDYETAHAHWLSYGSKEGRYPSLNELCKGKLGVDLIALPEGFDAQSYARLNPDIQAYCGHNEYRAKWHYLAYGKSENRRYSQQPPPPLPTVSAAPAPSGNKPSPNSLSADKDAKQEKASKSDHKSDHKSVTEHKKQTPPIDPTKKRTGRIDFHKDNLIRGWALPLGHQGFQELDLYIDNVFIKTLRANASRKDLVRHGLGHGRNGFEIALPSFWLRQLEHTLDVKFKGTDQSLKNSPIELNSTKAELSYQTSREVAIAANVHKNIAAHRKKTAITVVIPIFNAYDELKKCIHSVISHTSIEASLLLIDDCSTDERIADLLEWASTCPRTKVIRNPHNLGYTATINKGIDAAPNDDIVLLNSDTRVGSQWLQNLQRATYHDVDIATATAISDNSGAFSVPEIGISNDMPVWLTEEEMTRAISQRSKRRYPEIPTGSGFCIYIRRALFQDIGNFDEAAFPRGYGEENDFCMRAIRAGWRHVVDDSTLVYHVRSASFKAEKAALITAGRQVVDQRYPEYKILTPIYRESPELQFARYNVRRLIESPGEIKTRVRPRVLYVISTRTGGTPQTNRDLMKGLQRHYQTFLLHCDSKRISLYDASCEPYQICEEVELDVPISVKTHRSNEYEKTVAALLIKYSIELLHIRHIVWHSLALPSIAKQLGIPVIFSLHDFYTICPTVNLLDEKQTYCGGQCTSTKGDCSATIWPDMPPLKHRFVSTWQQMMSRALASADAFVTTSRSAKEQLCAIYPDLEQSNFPVIPHGRDFLHMKKGMTLPGQILRPSQPLRILFPGNTSIHKGARIIAELERMNVEQRLEIHFLGTTDPSLKSVGHHHGSYQREQFFDLIQKIRPHYVGIFSIWPETYCHTLTESWASGVPVIALDQGAVGERVRKHRAGWLIDSCDAGTIYSELMRIAENADGYSEKLEEVRRWQHSYGRQNDVAAMSAHYHNLYQSVFESACIFKREEAVAKRIKLGVFIRVDNDGKSNPSTHVRVLDWLNHADVSAQIDPHFLDVDTFLQDSNHLIDLEAVLVQRNTIKPYLIEQFIQTCKQQNLPIIFEIDDDLMNVPSEKDPKGIYARTAISIEKLARAAATVIASTQPLANRMSTYSNRVVVLPNVISEFLWFRPVTQAANEPVVDITSSKQSLNVLYMGNPTHSEDLALVKPVFERLKNEKKPIKLFVVGGERPNDQSQEWYQRIDIPSTHRHYPDFVKWLRHLSNSFDLTIAPLTETAFNQSKSALKYVQYSAMALPAIYSNCTPYREVVEAQVTGFLADNTEASWYRSLIECLSKKEHLQDIGKKAQKDVLKKHLMSDYTEAYVEVFTLACRTGIKELAKV